jgi:hypothetical protein
VTAALVRSDQASHLDAGFAKADNDTGHLHRNGRAFLAPRRSHRIEGIIMTDRKDIELALSPAGLARRTTIKALALGSIVALAGIGLAGPAQAESTQAGWRWCSKCQGMFYGASSGSMLMGVCPADGGKHIDAGSGHYLEIYDAPVSGKMQAGWSWCVKCQGFFYSHASSGMGHCPAGGAHVKTGSGAYSALIGEDGPRQQGGWRWCNKCMGMFYARASMGKCVCPADHRPHSDAGSGHYASLFTP